MRLTCRPVVLSILAAALLAGCSSSDHSIGEPAAGTAPTSVPAPTAVPDPAGATDVWLHLWAGTAKLVTDPDAASGEMLAVASPSVVEQLAAIYNPTVASDVASTPRSFENNPVTEVQEDGTVALSDYIFETPKAGNATIWYSGTAEAVDGCEAYRDARVEF